MALKIMKLIAKFYFNTQIYCPEFFELDLMYHIAILMCKIGNIFWMYHSLWPFTKEKKSWSINIFVCPSQWYLRVTRYYLILNLYMFVLYIKATYLCSITNITYRQLFFSWYRYSVVINTSGFRMFVLWIFIYTSPLSDTFTKPFKLSSQVYYNLKNKTTRNGEYWVFDNNLCTYPWTPTSLALAPNEGSSHRDRESGSSPNNRSRNLGKEA